MLKKRLKVQIFNIRSFFLNFAGHIRPSRGPRVWDPCYKEWFDECDTWYRNLMTSNFFRFSSFLSHSDFCASVICSTSISSSLSTSVFLPFDVFVWTSLAHIADIQRRSSFLKSSGRMTVSYSFSRLSKMFWLIVSSPTQRQTLKKFCVMLILLKNYTGGPRYSRKIRPSV